jgi:hypothetical protein
VTAFAISVRALLEPEKSPFDLGQFTGFELGHLRGHLFAGGFECGIRGIAGCGRVLETREIIKLSAETLAKLVSPASQGLVQPEQGITSGHDSPTFPDSIVTQS